MDIFSDLKNKNNNYTDKIEVNKYTQSICNSITKPVSNTKQSHATNIDSKITDSIIEQLDIQETDNNVENKSINHAVDNECVKYTKQEQSKKYRSLYELILSIKDHNYTILEDKEKTKYISEQKMILCSEADDKYNTYNFNKKISKSLICSNLQKFNDNLLSLMLFYNEYFKINLVFCNKGVYYKSGLKNYENIHITYHNKRWSEVLNVPGNIEFNSILNIEHTIELDVKTNFIYNLYLKAISNYKADELINIAKELNIDLMKNGKKKIKKELYDEINLLKL